MIEFTATAQTLPQQAAIHKQRMKPGRMYRVEMKEMRKGRTTGPHSQSAHLNGHIQQIAEATGNDFDAVKMYVKQEAIAMGWPFNTLPNGDALPLSETQVDTKQCGAAIDACHILAGDLGIVLREE